MHTYVHATGLLHAPPELQVWTPLPEHCVAPGVHAPVHVPPLHALAQGAPLLCQAPVQSQVCGCWPLHCMAPGVQAPVQLPLAQT